MRQQNVRTFYFGTELTLLLGFIGVASILMIFAFPKQVPSRGQRHVMLGNASTPEVITPHIVNLGQRELAQLTKNSKPIYSTVVTVLSAGVGPGGTTDFDEDEVTYDFGRAMTVTSFSATPTCGGSGATNAELSLYLSKDKVSWVLVGRSTKCNTLGGVTKIRARYAKWRVGVMSPFVGPGSITLSEAVIKGFATK